MKLRFRRAARQMLRKWAVPDRFVAVLILPVVLVILALLWPVAIAMQGRPFLHGSERMRDRDRSFTLWKLRTMRPADGPETVLGGDQSVRVTSLGRWLRRLRIDELPQVFNVIRGEMRFIGPRPPLRVYVDAYPALYARVLRSEPGITGLATVHVAAREAELLSACRSPEETDAIYRRRCIPLKARLDLLYARRRSLSLDAWIIWRTLCCLGPRRQRPGGKPPAPARPYQENLEVKPAPMGGAA